MLKSQNIHLPAILTLMSVDYCKLPQDYLHKLQLISLCLHYTTILLINVLYIFVCICANSAGKTNLQVDYDEY